MSQPLLLIILLRKWEIFYIFVWRCNACILDKCSARKISIVLHVKCQKQKTNEIEREQKQNTNEMRFIFLKWANNKRLNADIYFSTDSVENANYTHKHTHVCMCVCSSPSISSLNNSIDLNSLDLFVCLWCLLSRWLRAIFYLGFSMRMNKKKTKIWMTYIIEYKSNTHEI